MAFVSTVLLCNALQIAVAINGQWLASDAAGSLKAHSNDDTPAALDNHQLEECGTIQPASLLQKTLHPWEGDYMTTRTCSEIPVLKNTADMSTCATLQLVVLISLFLTIPAGICLVMLVGPMALPFLLIPWIYAWYYVISTGLSADYFAGAIVWVVHSGFPAQLKVYNCSEECVRLVAQLTGTTLIIVIYSILLICLITPAMLVSRMRVERQVTQAFLDKPDREFLDSQEFRTKCVKAFRDADADHNGTLDMNELQHVVLFDLTDKEKKYVQESSLFKEAFDKCDTDGSNSIDEKEFVEVMKFILTKAKLAGRETSDSAADTAEAIEP